MLLVRSLRSRLRPPTSSSGAALLAFSTSTAAVEAEQTINKGPRNDWSKDEIKAVYDSPVLDLLFHGEMDLEHIKEMSKIESQLGQASTWRF